MSHISWEIRGISGRYLPRRLSQPRACIGVMELENFAAALDELIESGAANYGDGTSIVELHQLQSAFEVGEEWAADGAKTAASWIATRCRVARRGAKRRVRLGRTLRHLPAVA